MKRVLHLAFCLNVAFALAACMTTAPATGSRVGPADIVANVVRVDTSSFIGVEGRTLDIPPEKIASDIMRALGRRMGAGGPSNANIDIALQRVRLTSPGSAFAFGGPSSIKAEVAVTDAQTGTLLFGPEVVLGTSEFVRLPGVIGVATSPSPERDYDQTVEGFAVAVTAAIKGPANGA
ncbi:hypothetical protein [uncultured Tateyamaria sp.]|uniref:hypothetical protein n=1 Tax=uncultured Tateyamaria sp. TaxID=455651 RepID=UPI0026178BF5|nr:hypothetical protein [uncultured Tateyamaria sp.]